VTSGNVEILATSTNQSTANATLGSGGLGSGIGFTSDAKVSPQVTASIEDGVTVEAAGNVKLDAQSHRAAASAATKAVSIGAVSVGDMLSQGEVNPTVHSHIGDNAVVTAGGGIEVLANILAQTDFGGDPSAHLDTFQPSTDVDPAADTIHFVSHGLSSGDEVTYSPGTNTAIGTDDSAAVHPPLGTLEDTPERDYRVIVVDANTIKLGALFGAAVADTGDLLNPQSGVDPLRDRIRFDAPHLFQTGDAVKYSPEGTASSIGGLNTSSTYYVQVIDAFTIKQTFQQSPGSGTLEPAALEIPNLVITLPQSHAWTVFADEFIVKGNNGDDQELAGLISLLTPQLQQGASLTLDHVGIFGFGSDPPESHMDNIPRVKAEMYCENIRFSYKAVWA
jgi:hypothetical protein